MYLLKRDTQGTLYLGSMYVSLRLWVASRESLAAPANFPTRTTRCLRKHFRPQALPPGTSTVVHMGCRSLGAEARQVFPS